MITQEAIKTQHLQTEFFPAVHSGSAIDKEKDQSPLILRTLYFWADSGSVLALTSHPERITKRKDDAEIGGNQNKISAVLMIIILN